MRVHVLKNSQFALLRTDRNSVQDLVAALVDLDYLCGEPRDVDGHETLTDLNVHKSGLWNGVSEEDRQKLATALSIEFVD